MVETIAKTLQELGVQPTESCTIDQISESIWQSIKSAYVSDRALSSAADSKAHKVAYVYSARWGVDYGMVRSIYERAFLDGVKMAKCGEIDYDRFGFVNLS